MNVDEHKPCLCCCSVARRSACASVIQIDEARIGIILVRWFVERSRSNAMWTEAHGSWARDATNATRLRRILALAAMIARCKPVPARSTQGSEAAAPDLETAIIERYRRRESSVEEALIESIWRGFQCGGWRTSPESSRARG